MVYDGAFIAEAFSGALFIQLKQIKGKTVKNSVRKNEEKG
jgi:hypothetical protein